MEIIGRKWNWKGKGCGSGGIKHPTLNPSYATTRGYSGPWL